MLFYAHSGLRYLVLLAAAMAIVAPAMALASKTEEDRLGRVSISAFAGLIDLQILLGVVLILTGLYYPALIGHIAMMVLAAVSAHAAAVVARRRPDPRGRHIVRLIGAALALVFIIGGIAAIGRTLFGSAGPSAGL